MDSRHARIWTLGVLAALAILAYAPVFTQPLIQDDYPNIDLARVYGPPSGWADMAGNPVFRYRATWWLLAYWTNRLFGLAPAAYAVSVGLHVVATWLVFALGVWRPIGWRVSAIAAAFFAVYEGHQEAVMWYSASNETLLFLFGAGAFACWIQFVQDGGAGWYAAALAAFLLALATKESAYVFAALMLLPAWRAGWKRMGWWAGFATLAAADIGLIASARATSFRFQDGSFSLHAPFWITWTVSYGRLLWVWGLLALAALVALRAKEYTRTVVAAALWIAIALLPYSFLTYMHRVPSRHTYLASVGLAWIVGAAFLAARARFRPTWIAAAAAVVLVGNIGYLWTRKRQQFLERAAPTEALIEVARKVNGPIYVRCYPDAALVADAAVRLRLHRPNSMLIWDAAKAKSAAADFCYQKPAREPVSP